MKKVFLLITSILSILIVTTGCTRTKGYVYKVTTGDYIQIMVNKSNGYDITSEVPFKISKDGEVISQGMFITLENYDQYLSVISLDNKSKVIETSTKGNIEYTFYSYNDTEYNYVIKVKDSNTGILLGNNISKESAEECFNKLRIKKDK